MICKKNAFQILVAFLLSFRLSPILVQAQCVTTYPYYEDFESGPGGWATGGVASDWICGQPAKLVISGAGGGTKCWISGGLSKTTYNSSQQSYVTSPCFDFTTLTYPHISFKIFWECEYKFDGGNLQYTINNGITWINVGAFGDPIDCMNNNWYNYSTVKFLNTPAWISSTDGWSGNIQANSVSGSVTCQGGNGSGAWVTAQHCLNGLAGQPNVIFRFTYASGTTCNSYDGLAFDDVTIDNGISNTSDFSYTCGGSTLAFTKINAPCPVTSGWKWDFGDPSSGTSNTSTAANPSHTFSLPGTYTVTLISSGGPCNSSATISKVVNVMGAIKTSSNVSCFGANDGSASLFVSGGSASYTYTWSTGASGVSNTSSINGLASGPFSVTVTDATGCTIVSSFSITEPPAITSPVINTTNSACGQSNGTATALASGGQGTLTYSWNTGASGQTITGLSPNSYTIMVIDGSGCSQTATAIVGGSTSGVINSGVQSNVSCNSGNDGSATASISGGTPIYTYSWSNGTSNATATGLIAGIYTISIIDASGCAAVSTASITEPPPITTPNFITTNTNCKQNDGTAIATATGGSGSLSYSWSTGATGETANNLAATNYTVTITDNNGCTVPGTVTIKNVGGFTATSSVTTSIACNGGAGSVTAIASGGSGPYTYSWSTGASSITSSLQSVLDNLQAAIFNVTVIDVNGCETTSTVNLSEPLPLQVNTIFQNEMCGNKNGSVTALAVGGTAAYTYAWSSGTQAITSSLSNSINNLFADTFFVTLTDVNGCTSTNSAIVNDVNSSTSVTISPVQQTITYGNSVTVTATGAVSYTWTPAIGLSCSDCANLTASPPTTTTYTVTAMDAGGCLFRLLVTIFVKPPCVGDANDIFIANVFSPNNDGNNDVLYIQGNSLTNIYWAIYDRWGNRVFETVNLDSGWDGTMNGRAMDSGIYVYYLKATCTETRSDVSFKGNISLIK